MAQSRPPPSRVHTTPSASNASPPPHSHGEKRHHSRRKSGRTETSTSEKKSSSSRPTTLNRKSTPQYVTKVGSSTRQREREESSRDEERRDSGESFPQFCMSCEKQFLPANDTFLYCSESCRIHDLNPPSGPSRTTSFPGPQSTSTPPLTPYGLHFPTSHEDGPDIIPRFSPTQSRPRSYFSSDPYPSSYQAPSALSASVPHHQYNRYADSSDEKKREHTSSRKTGGGGSSALESLREIAGALPKVSSSTPKERKERKASRDSNKNESSSSSWGYMPFTTSSSTTPVNSYTQSSSPYTVSQSQSYGREDVQSYSYGTGAVSYNQVSYASTGGMGMDRPLPPRSGPGGYGHRPKSIDLVTPFSSGH